MSYVLSVVLEGIHFKNHIQHSFDFPFIFHIGCIVDSFRPDIVFKCKGWEQEEKIFMRNIPVFFSYI